LAPTRRKALAVDRRDDRVLALADRLADDPVDAASLEDQHIRVLGSGRRRKAGGGRGGRRRSECQRDNQARGRQQARPLETLGGGGWTQRPKGP